MEKMLSLFSCPVMSNSANPWPAAQQAISAYLPSFILLACIISFCLPQTHLDLDVPSFVAVIYLLSRA